MFRVHVSRFVFSMKAESLFHIQSLDGEDGIQSPGGDDGVLRYRHSLQITDYRAKAQHPE